MFFRFSLSVVLLVVSVCSLAGAKPQLQVVGSYDTGYSKGAEIISVQQKSLRAALTIGSAGVVDILSLETPANPVRLKRMSVLGKGDADISSVAFHPSEDYVAVAVIPEDPWQLGRVELYSAGTGKKLAAIEVGYWPDSVLFSKDGRWLAVANEGEPFVYYRDSKIFATPPGSVTLIDLSQGYRKPQVTDIALADLTGLDGATGKTHKRFFEREVDITGNGNIDDKADFNGNGAIEKVNVELGTFAGAKVKAKEHRGEGINIPLTAGTADQLEPEYLAFSPDGSELFVSLQENNAVLVVDVAKGKVIRQFGLGVSNHKADITDDGVVSFEDNLTAFREPDGISLSNDGRLLLTADEGDTDPKASKLNDGAIGGGSRTLSVFDAATGRLLGDTGNQLDAMAHQLGIYPEDRSDNKGTEPESVVCVAGFEQPYAAVTLERADAVALINLAQPAAPKVEAMVSLKPAAEADSSYAPEGLVLFHDNSGRQYLLCANEKRGTVTVIAL